MKQESKPAFSPRSFSIPDICILGIMFPAGDKLMGNFFGKKGIKREHVLMPQCRH